jgi:hypothetical protein
MYFTHPILHPVFILHEFYVCTISGDNNDNRIWMNNIWGTILTTKALCIDLTVRQHTMNGTSLNLKLPHRIETHNGVVTRSQVSQMRIQSTLVVLGNDDTLQHILSFVGCNQYRFVASVSKDFQNAYHQLYPENKTTYCNASTIGHAKICIAECKGTRKSVTLCYSAIRHGSLPALQYLRSSNYQWDAFVCNVAAQFGQLHILKYLRQKDCDWGKTCELAVQYGHLPIVQWAHVNGCEWNEWTCAIAAEYGRLDILDWLHTNGCPWDEWTCWAAVEGGHLGILQWAQANGCKWDKKTCRSAAAYGRLDILQWAHSNGCAWDEETCSSAASNGHLEVLQWARERGCPWNSSVCHQAASSGHLTVLQWAHENGCPWDVSTCRYAANNGHLEVLQWAREMGCPWDPCRILKYYSEYQSDQYPEIVEWIQTRIKLEGPAILRIH